MKQHKKITKYICSQFNIASLALTFMTRWDFVKAKNDIINDYNLAHIQYFFTIIGFFLGIIYTTPIYILQHTSELNHYVLAWLYLGLDIWATRGLHYDGLADVGDALGSGAEGEKFWDIIHDSRLGAFGTLALFMLISGTIIATAQHIENESFMPLLLAPAYGRCLCTIFIYLTKVHPSSKLGSKIIKGKNIKSFLIHIFVNFIFCLLFGFTKLFTTLIITIIFLLTLWRITKKHQGCNGDFLGTIIICGQLIFLICM